MVARVQDQGQTSEPFSVTNGTKQGCVMAPLLFTLVFSAMLNDAFHNNDLGALIRFRTDGKVFNLRRFNSKTRTSKVLIRDLLFADDCALLAHTVHDIQAITNAFARSARRFGLTISLKKAEVIYQPKPGADYTAPTITIDNNPLKVTDKFTYLGSTISQNALIDEEISARIGKASGSFGKLTKRLWSERGVRLATKINVYCAVVLPTLLYRCEAWTPYRRHIRRLDQFHMRCLRRIANIKWRDMIPNTEVLQRCAQTGIEQHIKRAQLRWSGHFVRMADDRIPKDVFYGELDAGHRTRGGQRKRYKDVLKATLKSCGIPHNTWEATATDRALWRSTCHSGLRDYEEKRWDALRDKRMRRKAIQPSSNIDTFLCHVCGRLCASRIGLHSHNRTHANTNTD